MKRLLLGFILFLFAAISLTADVLNARMTSVVVGSGGAAGVSYADCSQIGTHAFVWFGDYSGDSYMGCSGVSTTVTGTISGAETVASGTDPGVASPTSGGNCVKFDNAADYINWPITTGDIMDTSEGVLCLDIYLAASAYGNFYVARNTGSNEMYIAVTSDNKWVGSHEGNNIVVAVSSTATIADTTWTRVCFRWSVSENKVGVKIGTGSWEDDSDADTVTAFAAAAANVRIGYYSVSGVVYMDNITIDKTYHD